ncbi:MAG: hypothetical protein ABIY52_14555 [Gemmatimonadaceae bacterium]
MATTPDFGNLDISDFTVGSMLRAGIAIRRVVRGARSLEEAAEVLVRYLYDHCLDAATGERSCALVRFYKTHPFGDLEAELQTFAASQLADADPSPDMRCLTLLGTSGDEQAWNSRHASHGHRAIPLPSVDIVRRAPMIARLIEEMGLEIESVVRGTAPASRPGDSRTYDVFHVEQALGSEHIPAQDFVERHGIESVVGFGGLLRTGELFAMILFSRRRIPAASAARFRAIALDVRSALYALDESSTWAL